MNLLLLTKFYPYGTGEAFIENEIKVLSEYYDNITVIACEVESKEEVIRPVPQNVKVFKVPKGNRLKDVLHGVMNLCVRNSDLENEIKNTKGCMSKIFLGYFEGKSRRIYKYIEKELKLDEVCRGPYVLYSYWFFVTARVGMFIADKFKPIYMFSRAHRYELYEEENGIGYLPYRSLFLKKYDNVFPCSIDGTMYLKKKYPDFSNNVKTFLLGTLDYGTGIGSVDGTYRIVSCSRMESVKRVSRIVDVLKVLDGDDLKIEWTHIGDGAEFEQVKKCVNEKIYNISCNFVGNMKNVDVMNLYKSHPFDLFINVSSSEGLPVSIMEAISFGIPVVATNVGGTSEIVVDGVTGKLIPAEFSNVELADIIRNFATGGNLSVSRELCRKFWEEHFRAIPNYHKMFDYIRNQYSNS